MRALIFPGQGCQKEGMGRELYEKYTSAKELFEQANEILGYRITDVMFYGNELELLKTINTQPAIFVYEVVAALVQKDVIPDCVAGHSLGEFAALVVNKTLSFEEGLDLVLKRALIAQSVCDKFDTSMAAVIGFPDEYVEKRLAELTDMYGEPVYFANYNGPGQVVITGSRKGVKIACKVFKSEGAKKALPLPIGGSFHSPYMEEARLMLAEFIEKTTFDAPICPIFQCVDGKSNSDPVIIKENLINHITHPVLWTSIIQNMDTAGVMEYYEVGTDDTLQKIVSRMQPGKKVGSIWDLPFYKFE
jgi:[acyl-carrier-protein] S-malonyltransferase